MIPIGILASVPSRRLVCTYRGTVSNGANASSYTFANMPIGPASADRIVVVSFSARKTAPGSTVSSFTIGGVAATIAIERENNGDTVCIGYAALPTGTVADVVVVMAASMLRAHAAAWSVTGGPLEVASSGGDSGAKTVFDYTIFSPPGGFCIGAAACGQSSVSYSWTGATERYDETAGGEALVHSGADVSTAEGAIFDITATLSSSFPGVYAVAAFGPA